MAITDGNNIGFYQGTKTSLNNNVSNMTDNDLAVATDEMQWYMVQTKNGSKTLTGICDYELQTTYDAENKRVTLSVGRKL